MDIFRLSRAVAMVRQMDELVTGDDGGDLYRLERNQDFGDLGVDDDISKSKGGDEVEELTHGVSLLADESVHITPGFFQVQQYILIIVCWNWIRNWHRTEISSK